MPLPHAVLTLFLLSKASVTAQVSNMFKKPEILSRCTGPRSHHRPVVWRTSSQSARTDLDTDRQGCSQVSLSDRVSRFHVVLPHKVNSTTTVPINFTLTYPAQEAAQSPVDTKSKKPLVLLLNGASVESFWYERVIEELAKKGFVIAASDYYRPFPKTPVLPSKFLHWCMGLFQPM